MHEGPPFPDNKDDDTQEPLPVYGEVPFGVNPEQPHKDFFFNERNNLVNYEEELRRSKSLTPELEHSFSAAHWALDKGDRESYERAKQNIEALVAPQSSEAEPEPVETQETDQRSDPSETATEKFNAFLQEYRDDLNTEVTSLPSGNEVRTRLVKEFGGLLQRFNGHQIRSDHRDEDIKKFTDAFKSFKQHVKDEVYKELDHLTAEKFNAFLQEYRDDLNTEVISLPSGNEVRTRLVKEFGGLLQRFNGHQIRSDHRDEDIKKFTDAFKSFKQHVKDEVHKELNRLTTPDTKPQEQIPAVPAEDDAETLPPPAYEPEALRSSQEALGQLKKIVVTPAKAQTPPNNFEHELEELKTKVSAVGGEVLHAFNGIPWGDEFRQRKFLEYQAFEDRFQNIPVGDAEDEIPIYKKHIANLKKIKADIEAELAKRAAAETTSENGVEDGEEKLYNDVAQWMRDPSDKISRSVITPDLVQNKFGVDREKATRLLERMEAEDLVGRIIDDSRGTRKILKLNPVEGPTDEEITALLKEEADRIYTQSGYTGMRGLFVDPHDIARYLEGLKNVNPATPDAALEEYRAKIREQIERNIAMNASQATGGSDPEKTPADAKPEVESLGLQLLELRSRVSDMVLNNFTEDDPFRKEFFSELTRLTSPAFENHSDQMAEKEAYKEYQSKLEELQAKVAEEIAMRGPFGAKTGKVYGPDGKLLDQVSSSPTPDTAPVSEVGYGFEGVVDDNEVQPNAQDPLMPPIAGKTPAQEKTKEAIETEIEALQADLGPVSAALYAARANAEKNAIAKRGWLKRKLADAGFHGGVDPSEFDEASKKKILEAEQKYSGLASRLEQKLDERTEVRFKTRMAELSDDDIRKRLINKASNKTELLNKKWQKETSDTEGPYIGEKVLQEDIDRYRARMQKSLDALKAGARFQGIYLKQAEVDREMFVESLEPKERARVMEYLDKARAWNKKWRHVRIIGSAALLTGAAVATGGVASLGAAGILFGGKVARAYGGIGVGMAAGVGTGGVIGHFGDKRIDKGKHDQTIEAIQAMGSKRPEGVDVVREVEKQEAAQKITAEKARAKQRLEVGKAAGAAAATIIAGGGFAIASGAAGLGRVEHSDGGGANTDNLHKHSPEYDTERNWIRKLFGLEAHAEEPAPTPTPEVAQTLEQQVPAPNEPPTVTAEDFAGKKIIVEGHYKPGESVERVIQHKLQELHKQDPTHYPRLTHKQLGDVAHLVALDQNLKGAGAHDVWGIQDHNPNSVLKGGAYHAELDMAKVQAHIDHVKGTHTIPVTHEPPTSTKGAAPSNSVEHHDTPPRSTGETVPKKHFSHWKERSHAPVLEHNINHTIVLNDLEHAKEAMGTSILGTTNWAPNPFVTVHPELATPELTRFIQTNGNAEILKNYWGQIGSIPISKLFDAEHGVTYESNGTTITLSPDTEAFVRSYWNSLQNFDQADGLRNTNTDMTLNQMTQTIMDRSMEHHAAPPESIPATHGPRSLIPESDRPRPSGKAHLYYLDKDGNRHYPPGSSPNPEDYRKPGVPTPEELKQQHEAAEARNAAAAAEVQQPAPAPAPEQVGSRSEVEIRPHDTENTGSRLPKMENLTGQTIDPTGLSNEQIGYALSHGAKVPGYHLEKLAPYGGRGTYLPNERIQSTVLIDESTGERVATVRVESNRDLFQQRRRGYGQVTGTKDNLHIRKPHESHWRETRLTFGGRAKIGDR